MNKFIVLAFIIILFFSLNKLNYKEKYNQDNICRGKLSDKEYLKHMIPHHQVAVDVSIMHQKISKLPIMQKILRELIWTQNVEIKLMKYALEKGFKNVSCKLNMNKKYLPLLSDYQKPNKIGLTNTYCDPHFFNTKAHMKHMKHMKLDDLKYIEHMIPHHQVAVDMSKVLLKNTSNDFMIYLAYRIIRSQQSEIIILTDLYKNLKNKSAYKHKSKLIV